MFCVMGVATLSFVACGNKASQTAADEPTVVEEVVEDVKNVPEDAVDLADDAKDVAVKGADEATEKVDDAAKTVTGEVGKGLEKVKDEL